MFIIVIEVIFLISDAMDINVLDDRHASTATDISVQFKSSSNISLAEFRL